MENCEIKYSHCADRKQRSQMRQALRAAQRSAELGVLHEMEEPNVPIPPPPSGPPPPPPGPGPPPPPPPTLPNTSPSNTNPRPTGTTIDIPSNTGGCPTLTWGELRYLGTHVPRGTTLSNLELCSGLNIVKKVQINHTPPPTTTPPATEPPPPTTTPPPVRYFEIFGKQKPTTTKEVKILKVKNYRSLEKLAE